MVIFTAVQLKQWKRAYMQTDPLLSELLTWSLYRLPIIALKVFSYDHLDYRLSDDLGNQGDLDDFIKKMRPKMTAVLT